MVIVQFISIVKTDIVQFLLGIKQCVIFVKLCFSFVKRYFDVAISVLLEGKNTDIAL